MGMGYFKVGVGYLHHKKGTVKFATPVVVKLHFGVFQLVLRGSVCFCKSVKGFGCHIRTGWCRLSQR